MDTAKPRGRRPTRDELELEVGRLRAELEHERSLRLAAESLARERGAAVGVAERTLQALVPGVVPADEPPEPPRRRRGNWLR